MSPRPDRSGPECRSTRDSFRLRRSCEAACAGRLGDQPGADGVAIGSASLESHDQEVALARRFIPEHDARGVMMDDDEVEIAVAVEVAAGQPATHVKRLEVRAGAGGDVGESSVPLVSPDDGRVLIGIALGRLGADVAVGGDEVEASRPGRSRPGPCPSPSGDGCRSPGRPRWSGPDKRFRSVRAGVGAPEGRRARRRNG